MTVRRLSLGDESAISIMLTPVNGAFSDAITLSASGLPVGATNLHHLMPAPADISQQLRPTSHRQTRLFVVASMRQFLR
jgi:hypothetical protein